MSQESDGCEMNGTEDRPQMLLRTDSPSILNDISSVILSVLSLR